MTALVHGVQAAGLLVTGFGMLTAINGIEDGWHFLVIAVSLGGFVAILGTL